MNTNEEVKRLTKIAKNLRIFEETKLGSSTPNSKICANCNKTKFIECVNVIVCKNCFSPFCYIK